MLRRLNVFVFCAAACLAGPVTAASEAGEQKPPPAAEKKPRAEPVKPESPPAPRRKPPSTGEERPRSDVPVSFPVDI